MHRTTTVALAAAAALVTGGILAVSGGAQTTQPVRRSSWSRRTTTPDYAMFRTSTAEQDGVTEVASVVGGTGAYAGAHGTVTSVDRKEPQAAIPATTRSPCCHDLEGSGDARDDTVSLGRPPWAASQQSVARSLSRGWTGIGTRGDLGSRVRVARSQGAMPHSRRRSVARHHDSDMSSLQAPGSAVLDHIAQRDVPQIAQGCTADQDTGSGSCPNGVRTGVRGAPRAAAWCWRVPIRSVGSFHTGRGRAGKPSSGRRRSGRHLTAEVRSHRCRLAGGARPRRVGRAPAVGVCQPVTPPPRTRVARTWMVRVASAVFEPAELAVARLALRPLVPLSARTVMR
jgi:hypothetical protein